MLPELRSQPFSTVPISESSESRLSPSHRKFLVAGGIAVAAGGAAATTVWLLPPERRLVLLDLAIGVLVLGGLWCAARVLIAGEAARRSRLVAAELIGVTFGGAALGTLVVTLSDRPLGLAKIPALLVIQLLGAVGGAILAFGIAFFVAGGTKLAAHLFGRSSSEAEGAFIGVTTGAVGGALFGAAAQFAAWFPFVAAAICGAAAYRAVVLYQKFEAAERCARDENARG